jgi:NADH-quinone oxidoreductase subunit A
MSSAVSGSVALVAYLALFAGVGLFFVFFNLLIGYFLRPRNPHPEKLEIYECGEPTIGSSFVQFDLRFYVVALIFIVFDVEVAFLFPWATVFGKAHHLAELSATTDASANRIAAESLQRELGFPVGDSTAKLADIAAGGSSLRQLAAVEVLVFFVILMVGYIYVWGTGALDWVRTVDDSTSKRLPGEPDRSGRSAQEPVLTA